MASASGLEDEVIRMLSELLSVMFCKVRYVRILAVLAVDFSTGLASCIFVFLCFFILVPFVILLF